MKPLSKKAQRQDLDNSAGLATEFSTTWSPRSLVEDCPVQGDCPGSADQCTAGLCLSCKLGHPVQFMEDIAAHQGQPFAPCPHFLVWGLLLCLPSDLDPILHYL
eukprot:11202673-Lingulodinium_polyedra.AAC.1